MNKSERLYHLDWLRVMVILTVFVYHSLRFFNLDGWHIKNATTYWNVELFEQLLATWMMPLCFVISGASVYYALSKSSAGKFVKDKTLRLLVPLVVAIFTHSAFQVYLERSFNGQFSGSFLDFYPHYFDGLLGYGGNFAWMGVHLWYVELLFAFSLIFLPLFLLFKTGSGQRLLGGLSRLLTVPGVPFLLTVPVVLILAFLGQDGFFTMDKFGGWGILSHAWFFLSGYLIASDRVQQSIQRMRWVWLIAAIVLTIAQINYSISASPASYVVLKQTPLLCYLWILAFLGLAGRYLNFSTPRLQKANEGVLPFYILHQPVLLTVGYLLIGSAIPDAAKYVVIAASSFAIIIALYMGLVEQFNVLRFLFGMKPLKRQVEVPALPLQPLPGKP